MPAHPRQLPPFLAPGARVIRRGRDSWQIGIDPRRRVVVSSSPERDAELDALRRGATTPGRPSPLSSAMARAGLLSIPPQSPLHVVVRGSLGGTPVPLVDIAGIVVDTASTRQTPGLFLSAGEPAREELDPWLRDSRTHIVVRVVDGRVIVGPLVFDAARHEVSVGGRPVDLTPREFELLRVLLGEQGRVVTKGKLLRAVWGQAYQGEDSYVYVHVSQLRHKLAAADPDGALRDLVVTEPGVGYRVRAAET